jgi:hypothetical protein
MMKELAAIRRLLLARREDGEPAIDAIGRVAEISLELLEAKSASIKETVHS